MKLNTELLSVALIAFGIGCVETEAPPASEGNDELGIARFVVADSELTTSVVGLDASGDEVARMELIHGRFALTGAFQDDYDTAEVDGRKLDVRFHGENRFTWETAGYTPTLDMPAHPASERELAAFLADPHVKPALDRWQIGFESGEYAAGETAYTTSVRYGTFRNQCHGLTTCGNAVRGYTVNTCGSGAAAILAYRISDAPAQEAIDSIDQCCPSGSGGQSNPWHALKLCPLDPEHLDTACGTATAACKGCGAYNATAYCGMSWNSTLGRTEAAWGATPLSSGQTCMDNNVWYGSCASGVSCLVEPGVACKPGDTCCCGGCPEA